MRPRHDIPTPRRIRKLPTDHRGFVIPWFVCAGPDGTPDFRITSVEKVQAAYKKDLCWICGEPLGVNKIFVLGPMCVVNRTSAEPPSHLDCSMYAVQVCPFLTQPKMRRDEKGLDDAEATAGIMIGRNPGVSVLWTTRRYEVWREKGGGYLFRVGDPEEIRWFAEGRAATDDEVMDSVNSGLPILMSEAAKGGQDDINALIKTVASAVPHLPRRPEWLNKFVNGSEVRQ